MRAVPRRLRLLPPHAAVRLALLAAGAVAALCAPGLGAQAGTSAKTPPPIPACFKTGSGYGTCEGMVIPGGATIVKMTVENKKDSFKLTGPDPLQWTKAVACGDAGCVYNHLDWVLGPGAAPVRGCKTNTSNCEVRVAPGSTRWTAVYVRQNNDPAILYAIWNTGEKGGATISGYVNDKEGQGVSGVAIDAYRLGGQGGSGVAVSGDRGFYSMEVRAGSYRLIPSGGQSGKKAPKYEPAAAEVTVAAGGTAKASFTLQGGLAVTLTLTREHAKANGFTVVSGEIETTQYGRPKGGVTVSLRPKADATPDAAVTRGARATICGSNGLRIWPAGTLAAPVGSPVDVVTDATGHYKFTMTVGTVPGAFPLTVWARDASGHLITQDLSNTSDDQTLALGTTGTLKPTLLFDELKAFSGDHKVAAVLAKMTNDATSMTSVLSQLTATVPQFGGLAYSVVNGAAGGGAVLVYDDGTVPTVNAGGQVTHSGGIVLSPGLWAGNALGSLVQGTTLNVFMQKGLVSAAPTFPQWLAGAPVKGWNLARNSATIASQSFEYAGWPYPATEQGACN